MSPFSTILTSFETNCLTVKRRAMTVKYALAPLKNFLHFIKYFRYISILLRKNLLSFIFYEVQRFTDAANRLICIVCMHTQDKSEDQFLYIIEVKVLLWLILKYIEVIMNTKPVLCYMQYACILFILL